MCRGFRIEQNEREKKKIPTILYTDVISDLGVYRLQNTKKNTRSVHFSLSGAWWTNDIIIVIL